MRYARSLLSFALLSLSCCADAKAVCFSKEGVAVDPSRGSVIPWRTEFRQASLILVGTVTSKRNIPEPKDSSFWLGTLYTVRVETILKGKSGISVEVFSPNDSGRLNLTNATRYLLFLHLEDGRLTVDACGNSAKLVYPYSRQSAHFDVSAIGWLAD